MDFLLEPDVAYLLLLPSVLLGFMALVSPGTGLFEVGAFFCLALAGYAVYNLSFNWWALALLVLSVVPFVYAIQKPKREVYLGLAILLIVVGSIFVFPRVEGRESVNPFVAVAASALVAGFLWIAVRKSIEAAIDQIVEIGDGKKQNGFVVVLWSSLFPEHTFVYLTAEAVSGP